MVSPRTLGLEHPPLNGDDVRRVQGALGAVPDGVLGPRTAAHIRSWKWRPGGFRRRDVDETLAPIEQRWLLGEEPLPKRNARRASKRRRPLEPVWPLRSDPGRASEFRVPDLDGAPSIDGRRYHAAKDWFAFAGSVVRAPATGTLVEVRVDSRRAGQIFGGTVKVRSDLDRRIWVFRHVEPLPGIVEGIRVLARSPIAVVARWADGATHAHVELWISLERGYRLENMLDPLPVIRRARRAWKRGP